MKAGREFRTNAPGHRLSSLQDLEAGRPLEVNETLGYASAKARELGLTLPLLEAFARLIAGLDRARRDEIGRASCREECRSWWLVHQPKIRRSSRNRITSRIQRALVRTI